MTVVIYAPPALANGGKLKGRPVAAGGIGQPVSNGKIGISRRNFMK
ncbi:hypothetical protein [Methylocaldum sp.]|nr:hypothetical protein [Methylocaldum sp.]HYE33822.1 hypothetical protein [Methylocaldum sp.]